MCVCVCEREREKERKQEKKIHVIITLHKKCFASSRIKVHCGGHNYGDRSIHIHQILSSKLYVHIITIHLSHNSWMFSLEFTYTHTNILV